MQKRYDSQGQYVSDDEKLARRLQMEEQQSMIGFSRPMTDQEREDAELALRLSNMDMSMDLKPSPQNQSQQTFESRRYASMNTGHTQGMKPQPSAQAGFQNVVRLGDSGYQSCGGDPYVPPSRNAAAIETSKSLRGSRTVGERDQSHRRSSSADDHLEYARRLQEEAFSNFHRKIPQTNDTEESDRMLALRMQEMEGRNAKVPIPQRDQTTRRNDSGEASRAKSTGSIKQYYDSGSQNQSTELNEEEKEKALAEFMAITGASYTDLSTDLINDILGAKSRDMKKGAAAEISPVRQQPAGVRPTLGEYLSPITITASTREQFQTPVGRGKAAESRKITDIDGLRNIASPQTSQVQSETLTSHETPGRTRSGTKLPSLTPVEESSPKSAAVTSDNSTTSPADKKGKDKRKRRKRSFLFGRKNSSEEASETTNSILADIPLPPSMPPVEVSKALSIMDSIPPPPPLPPATAMVLAAQRPIPSDDALVSPTKAMGRHFVQPISPAGFPARTMNSHLTPVGQRRTVPQSAATPMNWNKRPPVKCAKCGKTSGSFLAALDQKYHTDCFRCGACNELIDPYGPFKAKTDDEIGTKVPYHAKCYGELFGIKCCVCHSIVPVSTDGRIAYVKHPFFEKEVMCLHHKDSGVPIRACAGCKRFEPLDNPFIDLSDMDRCVCSSCFQSVVVNTEDVAPLWKTVLHFFEHQLKLPVWSKLRDLPVLLVDSRTLREQMGRTFNAHDGAKQLMCSGLCLTEQESHDRRYKLPSWRYQDSTRSFSSHNSDDIGSTFEASRDCNIFAIACLYGLPRDLTAAVLAHEATHAWIKLHPKYDPRKPLSVEVEEGCAQLISMLFLNDGLGPGARPKDDADGPSDERVRQYYKFSIERDNTEMFGASYRKAASVYSSIGVEALLSHVVHYKEFPQT